MIVPLRGGGTELHGKRMTRTTRRASLPHTASIFRWWKLRQDLEETTSTVA